MLCLTPTPTAWVRWTLLAHADGVAVKHLATPCRECSLAHASGYITLTLRVTKLLPIDLELGLQHVFGIAEQ